MKITQIRLGKLSVPLRTPFKTALRTVDRVEDIVVELHTDTGAVGYGEAPPTGPITGDTTGGIVLGRSGSPILQNGRRVGAVTHVLVKDPTKGYGILAEHMLEQAETGKPEV